MCSDTSSMAGCVDSGASQPANTSRGYPVTVTVAAHTPPTCTARDATRTDSGSNRPRCLASRAGFSVPAGVCLDRVHGRSPGMPGAAVVRARAPGRAGADRAGDPRLLPLPPPPRAGWTARPGVGPTGRDGSATAALSLGRFTAARQITVEILVENFVAGQGHVLGHPGHSAGSGMGCGPCCGGVCGRCVHRRMQVRARERR